jgi:hypothetical protein
MTKPITREQRSFMDVVDLTHDDMRPLYPDMLGIAVMVILSDGTELAVQMGATVPPEVAKFAMHQLLLSWSLDHHEFIELRKPKPRKVV